MTNEESAELLRKAFSVRDEDAKEPHLLCGGCMYFVNAECRRYPPGSEGFPGVGPTDWCGEFVSVVQQARRAGRM